MNATTAAELLFSDKHMQAGLLCVQKGISADDVLDLLRPHCYDHQIAYYERYLEVGLQAAREKIGR